MSGERPNARELAEAVREFLETEILPSLDDPRVRFRTLVAMNALSIVERESPKPGPPSEDDAALAQRLRSGDVRPGDLEELRERVRATLEVASPAYLARYERDGV